jgi:ribosomal protein S1
MTEVSLATWQEFLAANAAGGVVDGNVTQVLPFGAFVELAGGIVGLLPKVHWSAELAVGERIPVRIETVDVQRWRVSLIPA